MMLRNISTGEIQEAFGSLANNMLAGGTWEAFVALVAEPVEVVIKEPVAVENAPEVIEHAAEVTE